jgi:predicted Zn-dependent protease
MMRKKAGLQWIILVLILCIPGRCFAQEASLLVLSDMEERIAGKMAFVTLERKLNEQGYAVTIDPEIAAIGDAIAKYADRSQLYYSCYVIEGDIAPQAISLPGGYVLVSRSLLNKVCQTKDDIAFVLGHEIAHSALRHYADYKLQDDQQAAYIKQLIRQYSLFDADEAPKASEELHQLLFPYMLKIQQMKEIEADQFGALYALRAGYQFLGAINVLSQLRQLYGEQFRLEQDIFSQAPETPSDSSSHPTLSARIEQLELFRIKAVEVAKLFPLGRDALDQGNYAEASLVFETLLSLFPQSRTAHIGLGVARHLQYWDSMLGDDFLLAYPGALELEYMYLINRRPRDLQALQHASNEYRGVLDVEPGNVYANNNLGVALAEFRRYEEAERVLRESLRLSTQDFTLFNLALLLRQKYLNTQQLELKHEATTLMQHYLQLTPQDQVAVEYLKELEQPKQ